MPIAPDYNTSSNNNTITIAIAITITIAIAIAIAIPIPIAVAITKAMPVMMLLNHKYERSYSRHVCIMNSDFCHRVFTRPQFSRERK